MIDALAHERMLGDLLARIVREFGGYDLLLHHQQGEFHHDLFLHVRQATPRLPGPYLVVSTNCNGGVKEVLCFAERPTESALWHDRCPSNPEFEGVLPPILAVARTEHWFDPCELLGPNARSELRSEFRARQPGGGWCLKAIPPVD